MDQSEYVGGWGGGGVSSRERLYLSNLYCHKRTNNALPKVTEIVNKVKLKNFKILLYFQSIASDAIPYQLDIS